MPGRALGTMITYGYPDIELADELALAARLGAEVLEILPEWSRFPDPGLVRRAAADARDGDPQRPWLLGRPDHPRRRVDLGATDPTGPPRGG